MNGNVQCSGANSIIEQVGWARVTDADELFVSHLPDRIRVDRVARAAGPQRCLLLSARWSPQEGLSDLIWDEAASASLQLRALLVALDGVFATDRMLAAVRVDMATVRADAVDRLCRRGVLAPNGECLREAWAQQPDLWLANDEPDPPAALSYTTTDGVRHPRRPPARDGVVYARRIRALGHLFTLRTATIERDLPLLHAWFNEPRVNAFWNEAGDLDAHRAYLERQLSAPHVHPLVGAFDGEPFGYFEAYWAKEDRIAPFAEPGEHDRGLHMLVGATRWRGPDCVAAWLPSLVHYLFLDDPRTQAVVCEPRHDNERMIGYLRAHGFMAIKPFDFPHKRAWLMRTLREAFFDARPI